MARRLLLTVALALAPGLSVPAAAMGLAGGATGGGGGGGFSGGGSSYGGSSGSSCTGDDCDLGLVGILIVLAIVVASFGIPMMLGAILKVRRSKRMRDVESAAAAADLDDGYWGPAGLKKRVEECFFPIQHSWEARDVAISRPFVSDSLYERHRLQLDGLEQQGRRNRIQNLKLDSVELVRMHNVTEDGEDRFVARIKCRARDWVEDVMTGQLVNGSKDESSFDQFWSFTRHPQYGWVLDEIQQAAEGKYHEQAAIVNADEGPRMDEQAATAPAS